MNDHPIQDLIKIINLQESEAINPVYGKALRCGNIVLSFKQLEECTEFLGNFRFVDGYYFRDYPNSICRIKISHSFGYLTGYEMIHLADTECLSFEKSQGLDIPIGFHIQYWVSHKPHVKDRSFSAFYIRDTHWLMPAMYWIFNKFKMASYHLETKK